MRLAPVKRRAANNPLPSLVARWAHGKLCLAKKCIRHEQDAGAREAIMQRKRSRSSRDEEFVADNGLLHRRTFLTGGAALATAMSGYTLNDADAAPLPVEPWMQIPTPNGFDPYGKPS